MRRIAIIGGSGSTQILGLDTSETFDIETKWGKPSAPLTLMVYQNAVEIIFLARHGIPHHIPPHKINYRANIQAIKQLNVSEMIALNTVGGITPMMAPKKIVIPDQIIDYTSGRITTFYEEGLEEVLHIDFSQPYTEGLRQRLINAAQQIDLDIQQGAVYAATSGPRLESIAEISRLKSDGCDIVGMTGMPEAALARELEIDYACCALVVNWAAGVGDMPVDMQMIKACHEAGQNDLNRLLKALLQTYM